VPRAAVARRLDVGAEPEQHAVGERERGAHVAQVRQVQRHGADRLERLGVSDPHVVAVGREAGRDEDHRVRHDQG
jgi:hypothetical protein